MTQYMACSFLNNILANNAA